MTIKYKLYKKVLHEKTFFFKQNIEYVPEKVLFPLHLLAAKWYVYMYDAYSGDEIYY